jgi:hypothetical protein
MYTRFNQIARLRRCQIKTNKRAREAKFDEKRSSSARTSDDVASDDVEFGVGLFDVLNLRSITNGTGRDEELVAACKQGSIQERTRNGTMPSW